MGPDLRVCIVRRPAARLAKRLAAIALLLLVLPAGALRAELPPPATDVINAAGAIEIQAGPGPAQFVRLAGQVAIRRGIGDPNVIPMEIVGLNLSGFDPVYGTVKVTQDPGPVSAGKIVMTPPTETPANSFFDVFVDVALPDIGASFTPAASFNIQAMTTAIPFLEVFAPTFSQSVDMMDTATGRHARLTHLAIDPHPQVDLLGTQAQMKWTIPRGSETLGLTGQSIIVASQTYDPGTGLQQFNTEIVAMSLTGNSALVGPIRFNEQGQVHSPGQAVAVNPGPISFPANSFFDVFFRVDDPSLEVLGCLDPLTEKALVNAWPPLGTPYLPPGPCKLYNLSTGQQVGSLDNFTWVWTQPTGACVDADGDGVFAPPCANDCDDHDPNNYPGNLENCSDGRDNNCNQLIDCRDPLCLGRACDDGDPCTRPDVCTSAGTCLGPPADCNDNDPCTLDRCNPNTGQCEHAPVNCDDQNPCTVDRCVQTTGQCEHVPVSCDDGNLCTLDECEPHTGACLHVPLNCDDGNSCTADACDPATGLCVHRPIPVQEPDPIKFRDQTTILWAPTPDATHWNTYRGTIPAKLLSSRLPGPVYDQACFESDDSFGDGPTICTDLSGPPLGTAFYYLVSGENVCGESDIGHPSAPPGAAIPNTSPCPTPP